MTSRARAVAAVLAGAAAISGGLVHSQQLPRSGSIEFHTGWKFTGEVHKPAEDHVMGHGTVAGITFSNKGSGPLHLGPANCFDTFALVQGRGSNKGYCAFGDPDGDRIFTSFTGELVPEGGGNGTNEITGGTGKYKGITGSGPWKCKPMGGNGEVQCAQRLDYKLP